MQSQLRKGTIAALALATTAALPISVAQGTEAATEIRLLKERLKQLEAKVSAEHRSNVANAAKGNVNVKGPVPVGPPPVFISFNNGVFIETEDHAYSFKFGGRLQFDAGVSSVPLNGQSGNAGIRRARFDWSGKANKIWLYAFQYDFAGGTQSNFAGTGGYSQRGGIRDAWLGLRHPALVVPYATEPLLIQIGHMYEPFSLEALNSDVVTDFIERPLAVDGFAPFRHLGAAVSAHGTNWTVKGGVYSTSMETDGTNVPGANTPATIGLPRGPFGTGANYVSTGGGQYYDITGRATYAPIYDEHNLLHLGIAGRYHRPNDFDRRQRRARDVAGQQSALGGQRPEPGGSRHAGPVLRHGDGSGLVGSVQHFVHRRQVRARRVHLRLRSGRRLRSGVAAGRIYRHAIQPQSGRFDPGGAAGHLCARRNVGAL